MSELVVAPETSMSMVRAPEAVLEEAHRAAKALQTVIAGKTKPVKFNDEQYIEFEDWQVLARFYGLAAKVVSTTPVDFGGVRGFEARAVVIDVRTGIEVSAAEAMCLNDEEKWSARTKYEWHYVKKSGGTSLEDPGREELIWEGEDGKKKPKKQRVVAGEVAVPMFQLRSMSQTRACAKALRNVLAWVVVLAGYKPTVAEELTGDEDEFHNPSKQPPVTEPRRASAAAPASDVSVSTTPAASAPPPEDHTKITHKQAMAFYAKWKQAGKTKEQVITYLKETFGIEHDSKIPKERFEEACKWAESK